MNSKNIWADFNEQENSLFNFCSGYTVILWGYDVSGWFIEYLFERRGKQIDHIVDSNTNLRLNSPYILRMFDKTATRILITFSVSENVKQYLDDLGYEEGINYIEVKKLFYRCDYERKLTYEKWLEDHYGLDITGEWNTTEKINNDAHDYHWGIDFALMKMIEHFRFTEEDAVFDLGCGKGGALFLFNKCGVKKLGGVEYDKIAYKALKNNFHLLDMDDSGLCHGDAAKIKKELDDYNYFFMYDPFEGEIFRNVINNIEDSYKRRNRRVFLIYGSPYCHKDVIEHDMFKLCKHIDIRYLTVPDINAYVLE